MSNIPNLAQNMAAPFDTSKDYESGEFVVYDGLLYIFNASHTAGAWNNDEVFKVTLADAMKGTVNSNLGGYINVTEDLSATAQDVTINLDFIPSLLYVVEYGNTQIGADTSGLYDIKVSTTNYVYTCNGIVKDIAIGTDGASGLGYLKSISGKTFIWHKNRPYVTKLRYIAVK